jgi:RNA polymerase sigma factor (sigma-70 family)
MARETAVEELLRRLVPHVLGAVVRRYGNFDLAEDAVQESLLAASEQWHTQGTPDNPRAWLIKVASRRLTDLLRSEQARRRREEAAARWAIAEERNPLEFRPVSDADDSLILLFLCCHPALPAASQIALTLRAVAGLTTAEIARAFLASEATMTRRITRAKQAIATSGVPFRMPAGEERATRLAAVLHVIYLIFNEGYAATSGASVQRVELSSEAIRLARMVHLLLPDDSEVAGLLSLMLLTNARRSARTNASGELIPMADQDRKLWDQPAIAEGVALVTKALPSGPVGPYQLQAAIAAIHDEAPSVDATDWPQIVALYELLLRCADNPVVRLNLAVAVAMAQGPQAGLALINQIRADDRVAADHRLHAVIGHLLEMDGQKDAARESYLTAARRATSLPTQRYLHAQAARLTDDE